MKANPEKCHLLMNVNTSVTIIIGEHTISNSYFEKQLGVKIDSPLNSTIILKQLLKKPVRRNMLWLQLHHICAFQKESY